MYVIMCSMPSSLLVTNAINATFLDNKLQLHNWIIMGQVSHIMADLHISQDATTAKPFFPTMSSTRERIYHDTVIDFLHNLFSSVLLALLK